MSLMNSVLGFDRLDFVFATLPSVSCSSWNRELSQPAANGSFIDCRDFFSLLHSFSSGIVNVLVSR